MNAFLFDKFYVLFRRVALHKYDPPDLVSPTAGVFSTQPFTTDENVVAKTPIRCVSIGKEPPEPNSSNMSPTMNEATSSPYSKWFDDANHNDDGDGQPNQAARNLDFDDMLDVDAEDALGCWNDSDDSDDDLI
jgi:hypothetical protein